MSVELPKDAKGREIPLDTVVLFDSYGKPINIRRWAYTTDFYLKDSWLNSWRAINEDLNGLDPKYMYLTPPDSWEKLEEDLDRCIEESSSCWYFTCLYFNRGGGDCSKCARPDSDTCGCTASVFKDIKKRIRKLRGED